MIVGLPSGIGDVSWAISKLVAVRDLVDCIEVADGWPYRTVPYVELCGFKSTYGAFNYQTIQLNQAVNELAPLPGVIQSVSWDKVLRNINFESLNGGHHDVRVLLEPNRHLELGRRLEDWLYDLPTDFHYPLHTTKEDAEKAARVVLDALRDRNVEPSSPVVGISCASYRGSEAWKTWGRDEWKVFLKKLMDEGWTPLIMGGFWDDLSHAVASDLELPDIVGKTSVAEMIEVLKALPAYIGYSSGMNVIRTVVNKPAMAIWPEFQLELSTSWAPPDMIQSGRYMASLWRPVRDVWPMARSFLRTCEAELIAAYREREQCQEVVN